MRAARQEAHPGGSRRLVAPLLVALAAALPYLGTLGHGFALDDSVEVVRNEHLRSLAGLPSLLVEGARAGAGDDAPIWRPVTTASFALQHALTGLEPWGFHLGNVLLHLAASLLTLGLARRIGLGPVASAASAVLFALHPIHVEVVANVAGRVDALATVFVILTVLAHDRALRSGGPWAGLPGLLAPAAALGLALLSGEAGVAAIPLALGFTLLVDPEPWSRSRTRVLLLGTAYLAVLLLYLAVRREVLGTLGVPLDRIPYLENPAAHEPAGTRLLTAVAVLGKGLWSLAFPRWLSPDWSFDAIPLVRSALDWRFLASLGALGAVLAGAWHFRRRRPGFAYLALWYGAAILPAANLLLPAGTLYRERLLYLPSVAFCIAGVWLVQHAAQEVQPPDLRLPAGRLVPAAGLAFLVVLAARTVTYAAKWRDEATLLAEAVRAAPGSARARQLLGTALMEEGRVEEGVSALEAGARLMDGAPPDPGAQVRLGVAYERSGRVADAERLYGEVLRAHPDHPDALWRLGVVRWQQDRHPESERLWRRVLEVSPRHARAMTELGLLLSSRGDAAGAEALWLEASRVDPVAAGPWLYLGEEAAGRGDPEGARRAWRRFLELARHGAYPREREAVEAKLGELDGRR